MNYYNLIWVLPKLQGGFTTSDGEQSLLPHHMRRVFYHHDIKHSSFWWLWLFVLHLVVLHIVFGDGHSASTDLSLRGYCSHWNTVLGCRSSHDNHEVCTSTDLSLWECWFQLEHCSWCRSSHVIHGVLHYCSCAGQNIIKLHLTKDKTVLEDVWRGRIKMSSFQRLNIFAQQSY